MKWEVAAVAVAILAWIAKSDITGSYSYKDIDTGLAFLAAVLWVASLVFVIIGLET